MTVRITFVLLAFLVGCGVCHGKEERWGNFAEDADLKYYLDHKSVISRPDKVYIFWVKSVAKDKEYFKREYNQNDLSYILTNYELDCAIASYKIRGTIMFDKNRREINKALPAGDAVLEPVPPESMLELAQDEICVSDENTAKKAESEELIGVTSEAPTAPAVPTSAATSSPLAPTAPLEPDEPATPAQIEVATPAAPAEVAAPGAPVEPALPAAPLAPAAPVEPPSLQ
jgi:hypothetical protein